MAVREIAFELECFEWADERLEVAGRWKGLAGRRLNRPVLTIDTEGGRRKHLVAMPGGHFGAAEDSWRATFAWPGDPEDITGAELEVGGHVVVDLPLPDRRRRRRRRPASDADDGLRAEVGALRAQIERLRAELAGRERENMQLRAELEEGADEPGDAGEPGAGTVEIERLASEREDLTAEVERLAGERDRTRADLSREVQRLQEERDRMRVEVERLRDDGERARADVDDLREAFADAAAEAEATRDRHRAELAALEDELRVERATVARLTAELAERPQLPPPATESARRAAAAAPPTQPLDAPEAEPLPALASAASASGALDPPGPLRAGSRPASQPGVEHSPSRIAAWLRSGRAGEAETGIDAENGGHDEAARPAAAPLKAIKSRLESLLAPNGNAVAEDEPLAPHEEPIPGPLRTASAARARAGATVAARRSAAELWGLRILALALVAVLLVAFLLIVTSIA